MTSGELENLVKTLKALANPLRLRMIAKLAEEPQHAYALAKNLGISYPLAHLHLKGLKKMGLIKELKKQNRSDVLPAVKIYSPTNFELIINPHMIQEKVNDTEIIE